MSSRVNKYGYATATEVEHDIASGEFDGLDRGGEIYVNSLLRNYRNREIFQIEYANHDKYVAKWYRRGGSPTYPNTLPPGNYSPSSGIILIGIFDSFNDLQTAVDTALGYHFTTFAADYFGDYFDKVWIASYQYVNVWRIDTTTSAYSISPQKPCYIDLLKGYQLDTRVPAKLSKLKPNKTQALQIGYYRENPLEPISGLRSIDWFSATVDLEKDQTIYLPINDCVLGTLWVSDPNVKSQLILMSNKPDEYAVSDYFPESVPSLFDHWMALYQVEDTKALPVGDGSLISNSITQKTSSTLRLLGANNDVWHNANIVDDIGIDSTHPLFLVDESRTFEYHFEPQTNGSFGDLVMDSPRVIEIHKALNASKFALNELDPDKDRYTNLGYLIEKTTNLLGHRLDANGEIDREHEKKYQRQYLNSPEYDKTAYSLTGFGSRGIVVPSLPVTYKNKKLQKMYHVCHDFPQVMEAFMIDLDKSLSIEQGSEIRTKGLDGKVNAYPNQLALKLDHDQKLQIITDRIEKLYAMNLVQGAEIRGLIGGIGFPVTQKFIPLQSTQGKIVKQLPYFDYQKSQSSTLDQLTTLKINIGIILGMLSPQKQPEKNTLNPFRIFKGIEKKKDNRK